MSIRVLGLLGVMAWLAVASGGCTITNCDEGAICLGDDDVRARCRATCERLEDCGELDAYQRAGCIDACDDQGDDSRSEDFGECVDETSCGRLVRVCGQPPFAIPVPGHGDGDGDGDAPIFECDAGSPEPHDSGTPPPVSDAGKEPSHDAGSDPHPDAGSGACQLDGDCADSEGCRDGACHAKCVASCQCRLGDVCEEGLCVSPPPVTMSCETDCDCPSGDQCTNKVCVKSE
ncbi:MAG: hypothetical protein QM778_03500 [Myxococcales bacterium]